MRSAPYATLSSAISDRLAAFIVPQYLTTDFLRLVREWFYSHSPEPLPLPGFLHKEKAVPLAAALQALPIWSRCATAYLGTGDSVEIAEEEWKSRPDRGAKHYIARPLLACFGPGSFDTCHQQTLQGFLTFAVLSGVLRSWLEAGAGRELDGRVSIELACYQQNDEICPHQDLVPGRVVAINFYLDQRYRPGMGARLGFRNGNNQIVHVEPSFNMASLIPIGDTYYHWVEPFQDVRVGRYTISLGFHTSVSAT